MALVVVGISELGVRTIESLFLGPFDTIFDKMKYR